MNPCDHCGIFDKIYECCGRHPETGAVSVFLISQNQKRSACADLDESGKCGIYSHRPLACRSHYCERYQGMNGMAEEYQSMRDRIEGFG